MATPSQLALDITAPTLHSGRRRLPIAKHKVAGSTPVTRSRSCEDLAVRRLAPRTIRCRFGAGSSPGPGGHRPHSGMQVSGLWVRVAGASSRVSCSLNARHLRNVPGRKTDVADAVVTGGVAGG